MITRQTSRMFSAAFALVLWLSTLAITQAQTSSKDKTAGPVDNIQAPQQPATATPETSAANQITSGGPPAQTPVYGLQGVLVERLDGKVVSMQAADETFNPASAIKLATALVALRTFGPEHRFTTGIWTTGTLDKTTGTINGNLYVSGRDPSFHYEHAVMIALQLNNLGIRTITGDLLIAPGFTMNFNRSAQRAGEQFYDTLDATLRSTEATRTWLYERTVLGDKISLQTVPSVAVMGEVKVDPVAPGAKLLLSHKSSSMVDILKVLLCYSNNFMAERIGDRLGGRESVRRELISFLNLDPGELVMSSLSGLGVNRVSSRVMMKIFRALREELQKYKLSPSDIMPVAGIDPGTLADRFTDLPSRGSVIAKTGTLARTDGGASSLIGQMKAANEEILLFVIMNQQGNILRFRDNQDYLVKQIQNSRGGPKAFEYDPHNLAMRLADTKSTITQSDEYEPVLKVNHRTP